MSQNSFNEWFCLKDGRENFLIDPIRDQDLMFGSAEWKAQIERVLDRALLLKRPVRLVWWGQYGIGKTHRIRYTIHGIFSRGLAFYPVEVVARDLQDKSGFELLHYYLVNSLDLEKVRPLVEQYLLKLRLKQSGPVPLENLSASQDVVNAFRILGGDNPNLFNVCWRFLCGQNIKGETQLANVSKPQIDSSLDFASVLKILATVIQVEAGSQLIYFIDQVETLSKITNKNAEARWTETLRAILDIQNLSIIMAIGAERQDGIPAIMLQPEIIRRFTISNYVQMAAFEKRQAERFTKDLLDALIDAERRDALAQREDFAKKISGYESCCYPLTKSAFEVFCRYFADQPALAKPSEILEKMNFVTSEAYFAGRRVIEKNFLNDLGISA